MCCYLQFDNGAEHLAKVFAEKSEEPGAKEIIYAIAEYKRLFNNFKHQETAEITSNELNVLTLRRWHYDHPQEYSEFTALFQKAYDGDMTFFQNNFFILMEMMSFNGVKGMMKIVASLFPGNKHYEQSLSATESNPLKERLESLLDSSLNDSAIRERLLHKNPYLFSIFYWLVFDNGFLHAADLISHNFLNADAPYWERQVGRRAVEALINTSIDKAHYSKNFEEGRPWCGVMLGYRQENGQYVIVPEEAEIVRSIYASYLAGDGLEAIAKRLNDNGVLTQKGFVWHSSAVARILRNYCYTGNLLLQRYYSENHITKRKLENKGELPKYMAEETHEAIIDLDAFNAVQEEIQRRAEKFKPKPAEKTVYPFTKKIVCARCGKNYRRKVTATGPIWICSTYNSLGKAACPSKAIPEPVLLELTKGIDFDGITAEDGNIIRVRCGKEETVLHWQDRSRSESWTADMKEQARQKTSNRWRDKKCQEQ